MMTHASENILHGAAGAAALLLLPELLGVRSRGMSIVLGFAGAGALAVALESAVPVYGAIGAAMFGGTPTSAEAATSSDSGDVPRPATGTVSTRPQRLESYLDSFGFKHFTGRRDFTPYWSRVRKGVRNAPPPEEYWPNIIKTLTLLDALRDHLGVSIAIHSSYRRPPYNAAVGGATKSQHLVFNALDFSSAKGSPSQWAATLKSWRGKTFEIPGGHGRFTFHGGVGLYRTFVHVDTRGSDVSWYG